MELKEAFRAEEKLVAPTLERTIAEDDLIRDRDYAVIKVGQERNLFAQISKTRYLMSLVHEIPSGFSVCALPVSPLSPSPSPRPCDACPPLVLSLLSLRQYCSDISARPSCEGRGSHWTAIWGVL